MKRELLEYYLVGLSDFEKEPGYSLRDAVATSNGSLLPLFNRIAELTSVRIRKETLQMFELMSWEGGISLVSEDLKSIGVRTSVLSVISQAQANVLYEAARSRTGTERDRLFEMCDAKFRQTVKSSPTSAAVWFNWGKMLFARASLQQSNKLK